MTTLVEHAVAEPDSRCGSRPGEPERLLDRIRAEYAEMPGLNLTLAQAARLWNREADCLRVAFSRLLEEGFLVRTSKGVFRRDTCPRCG